MIVGGMCSPSQVSGFARAPLVLQRGHEMTIARQVREQSPTGESLDDAEWRELLAAKEAFALRKPVPAFAHAALWLLGAAFDFKDEAQGDVAAREALVAGEQHGDVRVLILDERLVSGLRDDWAGRAFDRAWNAARHGDMEGARARADVAFQLPARFVDVYLALLVLTDELSGYKHRAESYLDMARNSRGDGFHDSTCRKKARFSRELAGRLPPMRAKRVSGGDVHVDVEIRDPEENWPTREELARRRGLVDVSLRYYGLLDQIPGADAEELARLRDELDRLTAPYSGNPAMVALLKRKREMVESGHPYVRMPDEKQLAGMLRELRGLGWSVAVHNDYRLDGVAYTFWLFTCPTDDGFMRAIRGEATTDEAAVASVLEHAKTFFVEA